MQKKNGRNFGKPQSQHKLGIDYPRRRFKRAKEIVPYLNTDGMFGATFCQKDGHADPFPVYWQAYTLGVPNGWC